MSKKFTFAVEDDWDRYRQTKTPLRTNPTQPWQKELWEFRNSVGELRFLSAWLGAALCQIKFKASKVGAPASPVSQRVQSVADQIAGGPAGVRELLNRWTDFYLYPGEGYLAVLSLPGRNRIPGSIAKVGDVQWFMLATTVVDTARGTTITLPDQTKHTYSKTNDTLARIYTPDPENQHNADSPLRSALPSLREIRSADITLAHALSKRVIGAKILVTPNEMNLPDPRRAPGAESVDPDAPDLPPAEPEHLSNDSASRLQNLIFEALQATSEDPESVLAYMPVVVGVDSAYANAFKLLDLGGEITDKAMQIRESAINRLSMAADLPPEVLKGIGSSSNHWGSGSVRQEAHRHALKPAQLLADALTEKLFRPMLERTGYGNPDDYELLVDASALVQNTDRTEAAIALRDRHQLKSTSVVQALGFSAEEATITLTDMNVKQWALEQINADPLLYGAYYNLAGLPAPANDPAQAVAPRDVGDEDDDVKRDPSPRGSDTSRKNRKQSNQPRVN